LTGVPAFFAMIEGIGYAFASRERAAKLAALVARPLYKVSLAGARRVFFLNPDNLDLFLRLGLLRSPQQAALIDGIGIDLDEFRPAPLPEQPSFLLIARLLASKGIAEYVQAARLVKARFPEARFRLVGWIDPHPEAVREADLRAWIDEGTIEFLGRLEDVRPAIADCSVYVLPSYHEGLPRTVLEAMAMGRAIVTTDAPGCRETVIPGENGLLVPVGDVAALAAAMESFLRDRGRIARLGTASRSMAARKYDVHAINEVILRVMGLA
jgi:glycosyltransferase involved in cell wall biosynthesis